TGDVPDPSRRTRSAGSEIVEQEFRSFLQCGILAHGFIRVSCQSCGHDRAVPFSCHRRGWYPSCSGRRMAEKAAYLVDHVIPAVAVPPVGAFHSFRVAHRVAYDCRLMGEIDVLICENATEGD